LKTGLMLLRMLERHGFKIEKRFVIDAVRSPDKVVKGSKGRLIAQKVYDEKHLIRVIYEVSARLLWFSER